MKLEELLQSLPADQWKVGQIYSFDWHDGPRAGVCSLAVPGGEFYFQMIDERYNPDGLDDRIFRLSELPAGSVAEVLSVIPDLRSSDEAVRQKAERQLERIENSRRPTSLVILSQYMDYFEGCWHVDPARTDKTDWFAVLGIAPREPASEDQPTELRP